MKICKKCGKIYETDNVKFCKVCGSQVENYTQIKNVKKVKKKKKTAVWIAVIAGSVVLVLLSGAVVLKVSGVFDDIGGRKSSDYIEDDDEKGEEGMTDTEESDEDTDNMESDTSDTEIIPETDSTLDLMESEEAQKARDTGVHRYEIVVEDCTWQNVRDVCVAKGGYLATIESVEEYNTIVSMLEEAGYPRDIRYYLGGRREGDGATYFWVDENNMIKSAFINPDEPGTWTTNYWYKGEPSYGDTGDFSNVEEAYVGLFCVDKVWYLNDMSGDVISDYGDMLKGKVGYIIEYEDN